MAIFLSTNIYIVKILVGTKRDLIRYFHNKIITRVMFKLLKLYILGTVRINLDKEDAFATKSRNNATDPMITSFLRFVLADGVCSRLNAVVILEIAVTGIHRCVV